MLIHLVVLTVLMTGTIHAAEPVLPVAFFRNLKAGKSQVVVTYGSSLTEYGPWVAMLQPWFDQRYKGLVTVINSGGSGQHSGWGLANVQEKVVDKHPTLVFIEFGINDAHVRFKITPEQARANLDGIVRAIRAGTPPAVIVLQTMNVAVDANGKTAGTDRPKLDDYYANYSACAAEGKMTLIDNYPGWQKVAYDSAKTFLSYAADGLHPNKEGILAVTWPNIEKMLVAAEAAAQR